MSFDPVKLRALLDAEAAAAVACNGPRTLLDAAWAHYATVHDAWLARKREADAYIDQEMLSARSQVVPPDLVPSPKAERKMERSDGRLR